jgi:hypothetical protein
MITKQLYINWLRQAIRKKILIGLFYQGQNKKNNQFINPGKYEKCIKIRKPLEEGSQLFCFRSGNPKP